MVSTRGVRYKFSEGERVLCYEPDPTKAKVLYDSKVLEVIENKDKRGRRTIEYLIHFQGWNSSWDRCVGENFVLKDTEENRQLQRDLAEKAQLQLGAYLYRRERKKGSTSGSAGSSAAKRTRHRFSDDGSSSSTQPDEPEGGGAEDGEAENSQELPDEDIKQEMESDSDESSEEDPHAVYDADGEQLLAPAGRARITMPPILRDRLTFDYHLIVKRSRLTRLPASPNAAQILESFVKWFARTGAWNTPRCRNEPPQKPDLADVSRKLNLVREVTDGIRVYFDFIMRGNLLYKPELAQYHQVCGQFLDQQELKMKEELESDGLSQEEYEEDIASAEEDMKSPKIPEYSHLPPDPIQAPDTKENGDMMDVNDIKQEIKEEIKEEPEDMEEEGEMVEEMDAELQEEMREAMQQEMEEGMYQEGQYEEMQQEVKEEIEDQDDYQEESQDDYQEESVEEVQEETHQEYPEEMHDEDEEYQGELQDETQGEYQEEYQVESQEVIQYDIHVEMDENLDELVQEQLLIVVKQNIEEEIQEVIREELLEGMSVVNQEEKVKMEENNPVMKVEAAQAKKPGIRKIKEEQTVQEVPIKIKEEKEESNHSEHLQSVEVECSKQVLENESNVDYQSPNDTKKDLSSQAVEPSVEESVYPEAQTEGLQNRLRSQDLLRDALRSQVPEGHVTREGLRSQVSESHVIREGLRSQSSDGHATREGLRSQGSEGHVTREGLRSQVSECHVTREGLRSHGSEGRNIREGLRSQSMEGHHSPRSPAVEDTFANTVRRELHRPNTRSRRGTNSPAIGNNSPAVDRGNNSPGIQKGSNSPNTVRGNSSPGVLNNSPAIEDFPDRATAAEDPNSFANTIRNHIRPTTRGQRRSRWNNSPSTPPVNEEAPHSVEAPLLNVVKQEPETEVSSPATRTRTRSFNRKSINSPAPNSPAVNSPAVNSPAVNSPAVNSPAVNSPAVNSPAVNSAAIDSRAVDSPAANSPAIDSPTVNSTVFNSSVALVEAVDSLAINSPAVNSSAVSSSVVSTVEETPVVSKTPEEVLYSMFEIKKEPRDTDANRPATRNVARRLRSHKSAVSQSENEEPQPSTSTAESRNFEHSSSICSGSGSSNEEWSKPAEATPSSSSSTRTPLSLLLDKVSKYEVIPREGTEHLPCRVYGAIHLARLFVRLPDFLNGTQMSDFKLKLVVKHIDMFIQYLVEHKEWFGEKYYYCDSMSRST